MLTENTITKLREMRLSTMADDSYRIVIECEESMRKIFGVNQADA